MGDRDPPSPPASQLAEVSLDDKYLRRSGRIYLTGVQALVRLPLMQRERDRAAGLNTAGFISGYRGSPLGTYDNALWAARKLLEANDITFQPGVNEDLAATALWGTQQVALQDDATVDGVFGIWYGKGPGVDRSTDPFKHANAAGTSRLGGVLVLAGDDHGCQSSTSAHQSEQVLVAAMIPVLNPATVQDYLDFGLFGIAMSRYAGCWVGFKAVAEAVEGSATVDVDADRLQFVEPADFTLPPGGLSIRWPDPPLDQEARLHGPKMDAVRAFARANPIDRMVLDAPRAKLGIVTAGKAYLDVRQALDGPRHRRAACARARHPGVQARPHVAGRSRPVRYVSPKAWTTSSWWRRSARSSRTRSSGILYAGDARPRVHGKTTAAGAPLLPSAGEFTPAQVASAIAGLLEHRLGALPDIADALARVTGARRRRGIEAGVSGAHAVLLLGLSAQHVDAGCRKAVARSAASAVTGLRCRCRARRKTYSHMGGEGAAWIGQSRYRAQQARVPEHRRRHLFPQRPARDSRGVGGGHRHHVQDPLQRRGRDDRRSAGRG